MGEGDTVKSNRIEEDTQVDRVPFLVGDPVEKPRVEGTLLAGFSSLFHG